MLKFLILVAIILWIDSFFGRSETLENSSNYSINILSFIVVILIMIGFLS